MRVFLDTEFTDWDHPMPDLISIGMATHDGREFYAERTDFDIRNCTRFVRLKVLPLLGAPRTLRLDESALKRAVLDWLATIPEPEIAVDYDGDWNLLVRLLGEDMPPFIVVTNIWNSLDKQKLNDYYSLRDAPRHHALHDAKANLMAAFEPI